MLIVPTRADLSEQLEWWKDHRQHCANISSTGKNLTEQVVDEIEDDLLDVGVRYAQAWM